MSRQRVNPATGRDRAAGQRWLALTFRYKAARPMPPTMHRTCAEHAHTFNAGPSLIRGEGFADWFRRFPKIFVAPPQKRVQKTSIFRGCLILDNTPSIASIILDDAGDVMHAGDAGDAGDAVP